MLTAAIARSLLDYDPKTGVMRWRRRNPTCHGDLIVNGKFAGKRAGSKSSTTGHRHVIIRKVGRFMEHRLAWLLMTGSFPTNEVDHRNGVRDDNRWENLREATDAQQMQNKIGWGRLGRKGVYTYGKHGKFRAAIQVGGKHVHLGVTDSIEEAARLYESAAREQFGEFARTS
jgi:hypothetical protein